MYTCILGFARGFGYRTKEGNSKRSCFGRYTRTVNRGFGFSERFSTRNSNRFGWKIFHHCSGLLDLDSGEDVLFGDDPTLEDIIWTGPQPSLAELAGEVGVEKTQSAAHLQKRIEAVGGGDFTADPAVEWPNELGDIGRGINKLAADVDGLMNRRVEDERKKQELEYRMLQSEVNPHFIYNTLNSIRWMATIQHAPGIAEMVTAFARLTKSISKETQKLVPLQEELALLNDYFTIQQYRYGGDLEIEVSRIEDERLCRDCLIPRFTLQPLVENAIFHGLEPKGGHGSVLLDISIDPATGDVLLRLTDDGIGMPPEQVAHLLDAPAGEKEKAEKFRHVGLWNVNRRIQYSFGEAYGLTIESEEGIGTEVTIRLPYQRKGNDHAADLTCG